MGCCLGVTIENILDKTITRNRLIAEAFEQTGLVERSGQGMDTIFRSSITQGKGRPTFDGTTTHDFKIHIPAKVHDYEFIQFIEKVINEKQVSLSLHELYELELLREGKKVPRLKYRQKFLALGIIEKVGKTRGTKYILSHRY